MREGISGLSLTSGAGEEWRAGRAKGRDGNAGARICDGRGRTIIERGGVVARNVKSEEVEGVEEGVSEVAERSERDGADKEGRLEGSAVDVDLGEVGMGETLVWGRATGEEMERGGETTKGLRILEGEEGLPAGADCGSVLVCGGELGGECDGDGKEEDARGLGMGEVTAGDTSSAMLGKEGAEADVGNGAELIGEARRDVDFVLVRAGLCLGASRTRAGGIEGDDVASGEFVLDRLRFGENATNTRLRSLSEWGLLT